MKNLKFKPALLLLISVAFAFQGCKKGENDPFLSFRSRDARLIGDWDLSGMEDVSITTRTSSGNTTVITTTSSYSSGTATTTVSPGNNPPSISKFNMKLKIEKRGEITFTLENIDITKGTSVGTNETKGTWTWNSTAKRKSAVVLTFNDQVANAMLGGTWMVDQLKNKEIVFKRVDVVKTTSTVSSTTLNETTTETKLTFSGK